MLDEYGPSQVDSLRDRIWASYRQGVFVRFEWSADAPQNRAIRARSTAREVYRGRPPGVTYVPGLICHPCSRPHARVRPPITNGAQ